MLTQAITLVLHHPSAATAVNPAALGGIDKPGVAVLKELLDQAATALLPQYGDAARALAGPSRI